MKILLSVLLALGVSAIPASAITVTTPVSGAQVSSPFNLIASTTTCAGVPAVSMGYSIDSGSAIIEPTSFNVMVSATTGSHVLHVKCWGKGTHDQVLLNITVGSGTSSTSTSNITVASPANGIKLTSPFILSASDTICSGVPAVSMGYSIDGGSTTAEPTSFSTSISKSLGTHTIQVKCYGTNGQDSVYVSVDVVPPPSAATPQFSVASGQYTSAQIVSLFDATPGATIYYTTDGSGPTTSSPQYTGPLSIASSTVIEAVAAAPGYSNSGLARASYSIVQPSKANIPSDAIHVSEVQTLPGWRIKHDPATGGTADGSMTLVNTPTLSGQTAEFDTSYSSYSGVLYSVNYDNDPSAHNFVYDANVWIEAGSQIGNLEMDNNQVIGNGDTIIYAFQCSGNSGVWEYSENAGTPTSPTVKWMKSTQPCNPATWATNTWHHVQIEYSRDDLGNVTYQSVWVDGVETPINATVPSEFSLGWATGTLVANFQVDAAATSGSSTLYLDNFSMYRW